METCGLKTGMEISEIRPTKRKLPPAKLKDKRVMLAATTSCGTKPSALPGAKWPRWAENGTTKNGDLWIRILPQFFQNFRWEKFPIIFDFTKVTKPLAYSWRDLAQTLSLTSFLLNEDPTSTVSGGIKRPWCWCSVNNSATSNQLILTRLDGHICERPWWGRFLLEPIRNMWTALPRATHSSSPRWGTKCTAQLDPNWGENTSHVQCTWVENPCNNEN